MSKEVKLVVCLCVGVGILAATLLGLKCCCKEKCCMKRCRRPKGEHQCCEEDHDECCECEGDEKKE